MSCDARTLVEGEPTCLECDVGYGLKTPSPVTCDRMYRNFASLNKSSTASEVIIFICFKIEIIRIVVGNYMVKE